MNEEQRKLHDALAKKFTDEGRLIELGWQTMLLFVVPKDASQAQIADMRNAFFAGAQHLYASMMSIMDDDREPTAADLNRMSLIHNELEAFRKEVTSTHRGVRV